MKTGDRVKYSNPVSEAEMSARFRLLDNPADFPDENPRVDIQFECAECIRPVERVLLSDICPA